jgi:NADP-dependent 3-hydroxy acid dehydrogenase YdfG
MVRLIRKNAAIVNVSPGLASIPFPLSPVYCATKDQKAMDLNVLAKAAITGIEAARLSSARASATR